MLVTVVFIGHIVSMAVGLYTAVVYLSATTDLASGKLGGIVFSHNKSGTYFKKYKKPSASKTQMQADVRGYRLMIANAWNNTLNQDQRNAWNEFAKLYTIPNRKTGKDMMISGYNWFHRQNPMILVLCGTGTLINLTPVIPATDPTAPILISYGIVITEAFTAGPPSSGVWSILLTPIFTGAASAYSLVIKAGYAQNPGKSKGTTVFLAVNDAPVTATPIDVTIPWNSRYGSGVDLVGQKIFFECYFISKVSGTQVKSPAMWNDGIIQTSA